MFERIIIHGDLKYFFAKYMDKHVIRQNSFSCRIVNSWNALPEDVVLADSLNQFKNKLEFFLSLKLSYIE